LSANPDDRDAILSGIGLARAYQDEQLFDQLAETLAKHRLNDAAIQAQLGAGYSYFARRAEAEACFKASLAVNDDPNVRTQLALELLRQGRPEEAAPYLQFILDEKLLERLAFIHILIDGYQAQGLHEEALAVIQARETAFPELANDKTWKKQKKNAERYQHSGKKIKSVFLTDSKKAGYREGTWTARVPYLIGPIILLVLLFWYFSAAIHAGRARKVFIVNGLDRAYNVRVNGKECSLAPASAVPMELPEGKVIVEPGDASVLPQPINLRIETPFLSRPFAQRTFVINPDQLAILVHDEQIYSENPGAVKPQVEILIGQPFYDLGSLDYEFQEFPATQPIKKGQVLHKTRVALTPGLRPEVRFAIALTKISAADQSQFARRWLDLQPDDLAALAWVINQKKGKEALAFLEEGLSVRPIRVEWHRAYQSMMEIEHPETDLRPRYKQLIAETHDDPDALYLLARVSGTLAAAGRQLPTSISLCRVRARLSAPIACRVHAGDAVAGKGHAGAAAAPSVRRHVSAELAGCQEIRQTFAKARDREAGARSPRHRHANEGTRLRPQGRSGWSPVSHRRITRKRRGSRESKVSRSPAGRAPRHSLLLQE
jgi:hypothetical protein